MKDGLLQLVKLQRVDKRLFSLEEAKEKYPAEIGGERQREIEHAGSQLAELESLTEYEKQQRQSEREIEADKVDLQEHEARFAVVTTNKEYDALQIEIEACKAKLADHETQLLDAIEGIQKEPETDRGGKIAFEEIRQTREYIDELQGQLNTMQGQVDIVEQSRQTVAKDIDPKLLTAYEREESARHPRRRGAARAPAAVLPPDAGPDPQRDPPR